MGRSPLRSQGFAEPRINPDFHDLGIEELRNSAPEVRGLRSEVSKKPDDSRLRSPSAWACAAARNDRRLRLRLRRTREDR